MRAGAAWVAADGGGVEGPLVVAVQALRFEAVAPGKAAAVIAARRLFPFRFGGKPPLAAGLD